MLQIQKRHQLWCCQKQCGSCSTNFCRDNFRNLKSDNKKISYSKVSRKQYKG